MKKLHSKNGATLLLALLLLLAATMVSTVILTAVSSVSKNIRDDRELQQDYLTVSSAAEFLRDSIENDKFTSTKVVTETKGPYDTTTTYEYEYHKGFMKDWLDSCLKIDNGVALNDSFYDTMTMRVDSIKENVDISDVTVEFNFNGTTKKLEIKLSSGECTMWLTFDCKSTPETPTSTGTGDTNNPKVTKTPTYITWTNGTISKEAGEESGS